MRVGWSTLLILIITLGSSGTIKTSEVKHWSVDYTRYNSTRYKIQIVQIVVVTPVGEDGAFCLYSKIDHCGNKKPTLHLGAGPT